jgi:hypothetical protein
LRPTPEKWVIIEKHLSNILSLDQSLGVTSKALDLMTEQHNLFLDANVLTDIRPVFGPNADDTPLASTLFHTLKIHYHEDSSHKEIFIALDSIDLKKLQDVLQRAILKEVSLKKWLNRLETPFMAVETEEN